MSSDIISRQAVLDLIADYDLSMGQVVRGIHALPSVQPNIIRCKDCKYWREHKYVKETKRYIPFCGFHDIYTKAEDFCSYAERREE